MKKIISFVVMVGVIVAGCTAAYPSGKKGSQAEAEDSFCGQSTFGRCSSDSDCQKGGCSGQVCQSKSEKPVITTCEFKDCYDAESYDLGCKCVEKKCQWVK